jgi:siroheme synthase-like protein
MRQPCLYPIFLDLAGKPVLVAGAGKVALRKTRGLLEAGARVTVVAPRWEPEFEQLPVCLRKRAVRVSDLRGARLVFTATSDRAANHAVAREARRRRIPVNVADAAGECDFLVPARVRRGPLQIAISTSGESPREAVAWKRRIEEMLG